MGNNRLDRIGQLEIVASDWLMSKGEWNAFQSDWWRPKALGWVEISKFANEMHCMLIG